MSSPSPSEINGDATGPGPRTYRGGSLEELLPKIKAELGADAVVTRQRDGLMGGFGGFFQRQFVEVEALPASEAGAVPARPEPSGRIDVYDESPDAVARFDDELEVPAPAEPAAPFELEQAPPQDDAVREGLSSRAIQAMLDQAAPFADHLRSASAAPAADPVEAPEAPTSRVPPMPAPPASPGHGVSPEPGSGAPAERGDEETGAHDVGHGLERREAPVVPGLTPVRPMHPSSGGSPVLRRPQAAPLALPARSGRPNAADTLQLALESSGLSAEMAERVVAESVSHWVPFGSPRQLKRITRAVLARHIPVGSAPVGPRSIAFVGAAGAGKTRCAARLSAAYRSGSDLPVACASLDRGAGAGELAALLEPLEVGVLAPEEPAEVAAVAGLREEAMLVVDTPGVSPRSAGQVRELASELRALGVGEVHLVLPVTLGPGPARELVRSLQPLGITHLALSHADETDLLGTAIDVALDAGLPLSYVSSGTEVPGGLLPAEAAALVARVLP